MTTRYLINSDNAAWRIVDGEAVILSADTTHYYSLNGAGTFMWQLLLEEALSVDELTAAIALHHSLATEECRSEVNRVIELLSADSLITPQQDGSDVEVSIAAVVEEVAGSLDRNDDSGEFVPPALLKFDSLEKLIVSGE